ncbi:hypothetical protein SEA_NECROPHOXINUS_94 [Microbacterium phage Necrophoxinus]|nr:hypothetical protein SEA_NECROPHOXINUS_94 [Microbacterium phage Necrophoxinus]UVK62506.1 membrane protein [Microbacterium phage Yuma]WMI33962.1 hypothetical protein SEA_ERENYEAGER_92 [Microbacterium phage Erenyeager]
MRLWHDMGEIGGGEVTKLDKVLAGVAAVLAILTVGLWVGF